MNTPRSTSARRFALALPLLVTALLPAGCNYLAPAMILLTPPPSVDAQYKLDKTRVTVIFIDDPQNKIPRRSLRQLIGQTAEQDLIARGVMPANMMIPSQTALQVTSRETDGSKLSIVDVGRNLGAEVVIYAKVDAFGLSRDGVTLQPFVVAQVRIVDAKNNVRLFPESGSTFPVVYESRQQAGDIPRGMSERSAAEQNLAERLGIHIARVFYKYEIERESPSGRGN
ncbi:MAG: hypothetical protein KF684_03630 [Phycisphaeraceae bacterium]|nr:hypothetical protein [Phycisphaeraceae bacterium]